MARFCGNCGAQVEDDAKVCGNCGVPLDGGTSPNIDTGEKKTSSVDLKKLIPIAVAVIAAVVIIVVAINIIKNFTGYRATLNKALKAIEKDDSEAFLNEYSSFVNDMMDNAYGDTEEYAENKIDAILDRMEDEVGANPKISYEIRKASKLSKRKLDNLKEELEEYDENYDADDLTAAYKVDLKLKVKGPDDDYHENIDDIVIIKENGAWKINTYGGSVF